MTGRERCESGLLDCGPVTTTDSEGVPLCARCAEELQREAQVRELAEGLVSSFKGDWKLLEGWLTQAILNGSLRLIPLKEPA